MKKLFVTLAFIASLGICSFLLLASNDVNASSDMSAGSNCDECKCSCGTTLQWSSQAYWTSCSNCGGDGLVSGVCKNCERCSECEGTGKQKCQGWQSCSPCGGTGCKNGYTTNNGNNCAYGHCSYCGGKGGKYVTDRWTTCRDCSACGGDGLRDVLKSNYTGCTTCGGNSKTAGTGGKWSAGCKCSVCKRVYSSSSCR